MKQMVQIGDVSDAEKSLYVDFGRNSNVEFSYLIKTLRLRSGKSARALSMLCGLSSSYMSKVESGETIPSVSAFARIVHELDCSDPEILFMIGCLSK